MVRTLGPEHPGTLQCQTSFARTLIREGHYAEEEDTAREAYKVGIRSLGPQHAYTLGALQQLGNALARDRRYSEASKLFRDVIDKGSASPGQQNRWTVWYAFACVAAAANRPDDALRESTRSHQTIP
jgi:Tetratricopeptide repeat